MWTKLLERVGIQPWPRSREWLVAYREERSRERKKAQIARAKKKVKHGKT